MSDTVPTTAFYVDKGGVTKTTSTGQVGVAAYMAGHRTCLIDLAGTQNDLANQFGLVEEIGLAGNDPEENNIDLPISLVFRDGWEHVQQRVDDVVPHMTFPTGEGPDLIPADPGLPGANNDLGSVPLEDRFDKLRAFIDDHLAPHYDLVLIDLPGSESNVAVNGLAAGGHVVAPLTPGAFELAQLQNLEQQLQRIQEEKDLAVDVDLTMVMPSRIAGNKPQQKRFAENLMERYPDLASPMYVKESENISYLQRIGRPKRPAADGGDDELENRPDAGKTVFAVDPDELYDTGRQAREAYATNTQALLDRLGVSA